MDTDRAALTRNAAPPSRVARTRRVVERRVAWLVTGLVPVVFLAVFFAYPVVAIIRRGLVDTTAGHVLDVLGRPDIREVAWFTVWQATVSTLLTLVIGLPAAWAIARNQFHGRRVVRALLVVPFVLPTVVVGAAVDTSLRQAGLDHGALRLTNSAWAILAAHVVFNVAVVVRVVGGYWGLLDPHEEEAARMLGATRLRVLREVTLPRLAPALWSASAIVFLFCFTSFGVILTVGGPTHATIETEIWRYATQRTDFTTAAILGLLQLAAVIALVSVTTRAERRASARAAARRVVTPARIASVRRRLAVTGALLSTLVIVATPLAVMLERSLAVGDGYGIAHYRALFASGTITGVYVPVRDAIANSLTYAVAATVIAVTVGGLASVVVVYGRRSVGRVFDAGLMLPLGTSAVTIGFGIVIALDEPPLDLRSSRLIVPVAQALVAIPFVMRTLVPTLRAVDPRLRDAASVLGATPARMRAEIDLRFALRALLVGAAFAFAISLGEFGATSFLARVDAPTVPVAMFRLLGQPGTARRGQAMALGVILALLTASAVLVIERLRPADSLGW